MHIGNHGVEIIRQIHRCTEIICDIFDDLRRNAVGIVELDQFPGWNGLALLLIALSEFLHNACTTFHRLFVFYDFVLDNLMDDIDLLLKGLKTDGLHLHLDEIKKTLFEVKLLHHPQRAPEHQTCQISFLSI